MRGRRSHPVIANGTTFAPGPNADDPAHGHNLAVTDDFAYAEPQTLGAVLPWQEMDAHRHALDDAGEIARRRLEGQQRELRARTGCEAFDLTIE